jgi:hypothetical protein
MKKEPLAHCKMLPTALDKHVHVGKKIIYNSMLQCVRILWTCRDILRLLYCAKPLLRMKKRSVDNVVNRYQTRVKIRSRSSLA